MTGTQAGRELAARQAELLAAVLAGGPVPPGFDPARIRLETRVLHAKRRAVATRLRPDLVDALGDRFAPLFDEWATGRPRRTGTSFHADLAAFTAWLTAGGHLPRAR